MFVRVCIIRYVVRCVCRSTCVYCNNCVLHLTVHRIDQTNGLGNDELAHNIRFGFGQSLPLISNSWHIRRTGGLLVCAFPAYRFVQCIDIVAAIFGWKDRIVLQRMNTNIFQNCCLIAYFQNFNLYSTICYLPWNGSRLLTSSSVLNLYLTIILLRSKNRKYCLDARSGKYGGWKSNL